MAIGVSGSRSSATAGLERRRKQRNPDEREREREIVRRGASPVVARDLVAASYSHGDSAIDKGLVEERNILNFFWI